LLIKLFTNSITRHWDWIKRPKDRAYEDIIPLHRSHLNSLVVLVHWADCDAARNHNLNSDVPLHNAIVDAEYSF